jgi:hypothetical protein
MATVITCQCGAKFRAPEGREAKWLSCPRCKTVVPAIGLEAVQTAADQLAPLPQQAIQAAAEKSAASTLRSLESPEVVTEVAPEEVAPEEVAPEEGAPEQRGEPRPRKRKGRARREWLARVDRALAYHYASPFAFLAAAATAGIGWALSFLALGLGMREAVGEPAAFFTFASCALLLLTWLLELTPNLLILFAGGNMGRGALFAALIVRTAAAAVAAVGLVFSEYRALILLAATLAMVGSWCLWMAFLNQLGRSLDRDDIVREAAQTCLSGVRVWILTLVLLFFLVFLGVLTFRTPFFMGTLLLAAAMLGAVAKITYTVGKFDSLLEFALSPIGLSFSFHYLNFLGGVRTVIDRRT